MIHDVVIYKANETNFNHEGLGVLIDFVEDVEVTENNRGFFELKFTYSLNGKLAQSIKEEAYIKTVANERQEEPLIFRIYQCEPDYIERLIYVRARLKIIDDMMNSVHKSIVFPKSFGITRIIEGLFKNAVPSLNYRLSGSANNLHDISHEDDTVYEHLFQENGLFVMNDITPLYTPLGMTITTTRGNKRVDTITEQDFINKFKIIRERKNMITAIIPWTVTKRDEFVANEEDARRSYRDTVEEKIYGEIIVSPKVASHGYPFIAKFMEFKNEVTREWEENNRTMREYKYQSVEDLNKASQNFFTENKGMDEYSIEASIETLGLHMDYMKRLSSLGLYDEVEFYLEEHDLKIVLAVSEVTYSPSLDMNLALTFQSNTSTLSKAGQRINANAPSERDLQNLIERERLKEIVRNYIDKDDGTRTYWVSELPDPATAGEQDIAFLETAEGKSIWVLINGVWVEKLPLNFEERLRDELERIDTQTQTMEVTIQANEAKAREAFEQAGASADLATEAQRIADETKQAHATLIQEVNEAKADLVQKGERLVQIQNQYTTIEQWKQATDPKLSQIVSDAQNLLNQVNTLDGRLDTVEPVLDELGRQIGTKLTQADLSGYVTTTQLTAKAGELTQEISRVQGLIPTEVGTENIIPFKAINPGYNVQTTQDFTISGWARMFLPTEEVKTRFKAGKTYTIRYEAELVERATPPTLYELKVGFTFYSPSDATFRTHLLTRPLQNIGDKIEFVRTFVMPNIPDDVSLIAYTNRYTTNGVLPEGYDKVRFTNFKISEGAVVTPWSPHPDDYPSYAVVNEIKQTADSNSATIRDTQGNLTNLTQTVNSIKSSVEHTILDPDTGKIAQLQSQITQQAGEISQRLTRTEVESLVTQKGYLSTTVFDNYKTETAQGLTQRFEEIQGLIPGKSGGVNHLLYTDGEGKTAFRYYDGGVLGLVDKTSIVVSDFGRVLSVVRPPTDLVGASVMVTSGMYGKTLTIHFDTDYTGDSMMAYYRFDTDPQKSLVIPIVNGARQFKIALPSKDAMLYIGIGVFPTFTPYKIMNLMGEFGDIRSDWRASDILLKDDFYSFKSSYERTAKHVIDNLSSVIKKDGQWYTTINNRLRTAEGNFDTLSRTTEKLVKTQEEEYYLSTSQTALTGGTWQTSIPSRTTGQSIWRRYRDVYADGTKSAWKPSVNGVNITGDKGDQGIQGIQGLPGPKGTDGKTSYTHIAYANSADGRTGFSVTDSNREYIGMYVDFNQTGSSSPADYHWTKVKGADGSQGTPGPKGADGRTPYLHIAYATNSTGTAGFSTTDSVGKTYIGQYTDYIQSDSTNPSSYKWTLIQGPKGDQGVQGTKGRGITAVVMEYGKSTSNTVPPYSWASTPPQANVYPIKEYVWEREKITWDMAPTTTRTTPRLSEVGNLARDFRVVNDTVTAYERIMGGTDDQGRLTKLTQQLQTNAGFKQAVTDKISGLQTTTTQLAGSWAVQNLDSRGKVLSELNLNSGGVKIAGKLINLDGTVSMNSAFAKKLMVDTFSTNDMTAFMGKFGSIIANNLDVNNLSGNKATLLQALFQSANANIRISGDGIESWRNSGERGMVLDSIGMKVVGTYNQTAGYFSYTKSMTQSNYSRDSIGINVKYKYDLMLGYEGSYVYSNNNLYHIGLHMDGRTGDIGIEQNLTLGGKLNGINVQSGSGRISLLTDAGSGIEVERGRLYVVYGGERKQIT